MRALTDVEVALLHADNVEVSAGLEVLRPDLTVREDISDDLVGGTVTRGLLNTIHGTCSLSITRELVWGNDLVRPTMTLTAGDLSARFPLGVYCLTTPERRFGEEPMTFEVQGQDRLYWLNRPTGRDWFANAGVTYRQALLDTFVAAGVTGVLIEGAAANSVLPKLKSWPRVRDNQSDPDQTTTSVTWLRVVNDLLQAINFRAVWCDENGLYRCEAYRAPKDQPVRFTFSDRDIVGPDARMLQTILGEDRRVIADVWGVPNKWVAIANNPPDGVVPTEANGLIQVRENLYDGPTAQINRSPAEWVADLSYDAADATALAGLIDRRVASDLAVTTRYEVTVGPFPAAGHADVYRYVDSAAGVDRRVQLMGYDIDLTGEDTRMTWEAVA